MAQSCALGYALLPAVVHPNPFGNGPGRFGTALVLFRFAHLESGGFEIQTIFLSVPRSTAVFNFWGLDPVYRVGCLLDSLTFRRFGILRTMPGRFEPHSIAQHGVIHQTALEGKRHVWEETRWTRGG